MQPGAPEQTRRGWRKLISVSVAVATMAIGAGIASAPAGATAGSGGTGPGGTSGGGVGTGGAPKLADVICLTRCADLREATIGSRVQLRGKNLDGVGAVKFAATGGGRVGATEVAVTATTVDVKVPERATTGTVRADAYGTALETPADKPLTIVGADEIPQGGQFKLTSAEAVPRQTFYDGKRGPRVSYVFQGKAATDVRVEVVNRETKEVVATFIQRGAEPNTSNTAKWNGLATGGGPAPGADYKFRLGSAAGGSTTATDESGFGYHLYRFPLQAKHTYGDGYGAGRGHQGQDVAARCGAPIHAVRGGTVQTIDFQSAAGNYIVIDGKGTKVDTFYAHMIRPSPLRDSARVKTGQVIGNVGQTGDASGCHLHFEIWTAPGWYEGGAPMPTVTRLMRTWDTWS